METTPVQDPQVTGKAGLFKRLKRGSQASLLRGRGRFRTMMALLAVGALGVFYLVGAATVGGLNTQGPEGPALDAKSSGAGNGAVGNGIERGATHTREAPAGDDAAGPVTGMKGSAEPDSPAAAPETGTADQGQRFAQSQSPVISRPGAPGVDMMPPVVGPGPVGDGTGIVRTGNLEVRITKGAFGDRWAEAGTIAGKYGGFVMGSSADQVKGRLSRGTITVRVPADKFDATVTDFQKLGRLVNLSTSSNDVSGQLTDYDARLRAAQAQEIQLLELLKQARTVSDSLAIRTPLAEIRREIEMIQAEKAGLENQVKFATLSVSIYEPGAAFSRPEPVPAVGTLGQAWEKGMQAAATTAAGIIVSLGYLLPLAAVAALIWGGLKLRRRTA